MGLNPSIALTLSPTALHNHRQWLVGKATCSTRCMQAATLLDQACNHDDTSMSAGKASMAAAGSDAAKQQQLVRRASKALLKQVEESRRKYTAEVDGLKAELQLLNRQALKDRRDADLASVTAAAAKKAALEATEELERINDDVLRAKRAVQQLHRLVPEL